MPATSPISRAADHRPVGGLVLSVLSLLAVGVQLYGLYRPMGPPVPPWFPYADKVEHALGFGLPVLLILLTMNWYADRRREAVSRRAVGAVLVIFVVHAVVSEIIQHFCYASRSGDPWDVLADVVGVGAGWLGYRGLTGAAPVRKVVVEE